MLAFNVTGAPVSGSSTVVFEKNLGGLGPIRVYVKANGGTLTNAVLALAPEVGGDYATEDSSTFASLGSGVTRSKVIRAPIDALKITCNAGSATSVDVKIATGLDMGDLISVEEGGGGGDGGDMSVDTLTLGGRYRLSVDQSDQLRIHDMVRWTEEQVATDLIYDGGNSLGVKVYRVIGVGDVTAAVSLLVGYRMDMLEKTAPESVGTVFQGVRLYLKDTGGGKVALMARFPTGDDQQVAAET